MASFLKLLDQDNLSLEEYAWYAGDMNVNDAREHLDHLPVGKLFNHFYCEVLLNRYLSRFFDCLAHPNLSAILII